MVVSKPRLNAQLWIGIGSWTAAEFAEFFHNLDALNNLIQRERRRPRPLAVERIKYASLGVTDLSGLGKVVREIRIFVRDILERRDTKEDRELSRESKRQDILAKKIANAERLVKLSKSAEMGPKARNRMIEQ